MLKKYVCFLATFSLFLLSCGGGESDETEESNETAAYDRAEMLKYWADKIIIPSYNSFSSSLSALDSKTKTFVETPNQANLSDLRTAWLNSYKAWQHVEMFDIGKAEEIFYKSKMNIYPVDKSWLENSVSTESFDLDNANSYSSQGLPALDYLLNGVAASDNDIITKYTANNKYKNYLSAVVAKMISNTKLVVDDWSTYKASFVSSTANTSTSSANKLINDFIYYYEKGFRANKVGIPAGIFSGSPLPGNVEAFYKKDVSKDRFPIFNNLIKYSIKYFNDVVKKNKKYKKPNSSEIKALLNLVSKLEKCPDNMKPEDIQTEIYTVGKNNGYKENLREWFKLIYEVVFGAENGPRLGFFISFFGRKEMISLIKEKIN